MELDCESLRKGRTFAMPDIRSKYSPKYKSIEKGVQKFNDINKQANSSTEKQTTLEKLLIKLKTKPINMYLKEIQYLIKSKLNNSFCNVAKLSPCKGINLYHKRSSYEKALSNLRTIEKSVCDDCSDYNAKSFSKDGVDVLKTSTNTKRNKTIEKLKALARKRNTARLERTTQRKREVKLEMRRKKSRILAQLKEKETRSFRLM